MGELTGMQQGTINFNLLFVAYEEFKDKTRKSDIVKSGIVSGEDTAEFGGSIDLSSIELWSELVKDGYQTKLRETLGEDFLYVDDIVEDLKDFEVFKGKEHIGKVYQASKLLKEEPIRVVVQNKIPKTVEERRELVEGFSYLTDLDTGNGEVVYESDIVSVRDYLNADGLDYKTYKNIMGTSFLNKGLEYRERELLQDALHNKMIGNLNNKEDIVSREFLNFKEEYEGMLGLDLGINVDIKLVGLEDSEEGTVELEGLVEPINELNNNMSRALGTGILSMDNISFDDKGDVVAYETPESIVKLKVYIPNKGNTVFRLGYHNDKRKKNFGKISNVISFNLDKDYNLIHDTDDYLKYISKV